MNQSTAEKKWLDGQGGAEDHGRRELAGGAGTEAETTQALMTYAGEPARKRGPRPWSHLVIVDDK
jgi:hypothetical protein